MQKRIQTPPYWEGDMREELVKVFDQWYRATVNPKWMILTCPETIERRANLSIEEFIEKFEKPGIPVILTDLTSKWTANTMWSKKNLLKRYSETIFRTGSHFKLSLKNYFKYLQSQNEHKPLYLFDQNYPENAPDLLFEYQIPEYFSEDLFGLAGEDDRPPWRWILHGPAGSGVPFHTDPRGTSAWNSIIYGSKRWGLYPPNIHPPGVGPDDDEYYNAPTALKWWLQVYPKIEDQKLKPLECHLNAGETIFVPSGWWHSVYNTDETMAVTHNFASTYNFKSVATDLIDSDDEFTLKFRNCIKEKRSDLFEKWKELEAEMKISSSDSNSSSNEF